jgi:hypothetical protein
MIENLRGKVALMGATMTVLMLGGIALAGGASATPADPVGDAFDTLQGKVTLYGAAVVALVVSVVVLFFGIKFLRKGANKA